MGEGIKGYKVFNSDWTCRGFQYEVGKIFEEDVTPSCCDRGFHFCLKASDCFNYYKFCSDNKVAEVVALGDVDYADANTKCCTNRIRIVREILLFVTLPTPNYSKIPQIKRRYSIIHSDEYYVRLFYPAPSVIISKPLSTKEAGTSPSKVWFPASFSHHSNSYGLQNYDNHICRRKQSLNAKFL